MNQIQAVIFDWAGTTVDFGCFAPVSVFIEVFKKREIEISMEEARAPMGLLKKDHIRALCDMERISSLWVGRYGRKPTEDDINDLYDDFEPRLFDILRYHAEPIHGVLPLMEWLRSEGIKIGSTTGYTADMMHIVAEEAKKRGYAPDCLVTPSDVPAGRPYPWMIFQNAIRLGVYPMSSIIKVGDTISDIQEGIHAEVWTVGVVIGSSELGLGETEMRLLDSRELEKRVAEVKEKMKAAGAHYVIETIAQIKEVVIDINEQLRRNV